MVELLRQVVIFLNSIAVPLSLKSAIVFKCGGQYTQLFQRHKVVMWFVAIVNKRSTCLALTVWKHSIIFKV